MLLLVMVIRWVMKFSDLTSRMLGRDEWTKKKAVVSFFILIILFCIYLASVRFSMPNHGYNLLLSDSFPSGKPRYDNENISIKTNSFNFTVLNFSISALSLWCPELRIKVTIVNDLSGFKERNKVLVYLLDPENFIKWQRNESFSPIKAFGENEEICESAQLLFYKHTYFLVIQNLFSNDITVDVEARLNYIDRIKFNLTNFLGFVLLILIIFGIILVLECWGI